MKCVSNKLIYVYVLHRRYISRLNPTCAALHSELLGLWMLSVIQYCWKHRASLLDCENESTKICNKLETLTVDTSQQFWMLNNYFCQIHLKTCKLISNLHCSHSMRNKNCYSLSFHQGLIAWLITVCIILMVLKSWWITKNHQGSWTVNLIQHQTAVSKSNLCGAKMCNTLRPLM